MSTEQHMYDLAGWRKVSCAESERVRTSADVEPVSSLTDPDGVHGPAVVYTEWGDAGSGQPLLREYLWKDDERPCEHYVPDEAP